MYVYIQNILKKFYEWPKWEGVTHNILFVLVTYILYLFFVNKKERTLSNILLFSIIIGIDTLIHQNMNMRNHKITNYL